VTRDEEYRKAWSEAQRLRNRATQMAAAQAGNAFDATANDLSESEERWVKAFREQAE
jgi:hypothetical protein